MVKSRIQLLYKVVKHYVTTRRGRRRPQSPSLRDEQEVEDFRGYILCIENEEKAGTQTAKRLKNSDVCRGRLNGTLRKHGIFRAPGFGVAPSFSGRRTESEGGAGRSNNFPLGTMSRRQFFGRIGGRTRDCRGAEGTREESSEDEVVWETCL